MQIKENLTTSNYKKRTNKQNKYIVIHYTANNGDTALGNTKYFKDTYRGASANYFVDEKEIYRCVRDEDMAFHCGTTGKYYHNTCRNDNSIGIELCSRKDKNGKYYFLQDTINNAVELVRELMGKYNIPIENVIRHYDVTHKNCPAPFVEDVGAWNSFKNRLVEDMEDKMIKELIDEGYNKEEIKGALRDLMNVRRSEDWKVAGSDYLHAQGAFTSPHNQNEIVTIGLLGTIKKNMEKHIREQGIISFL